MRRREFLEQCGRGAFACALPPFSGAATRRDPPEGQDAGDLRSLVDRLKHSLPQWMAEAAVPGAGIAIIADGKLAWRGSFGLSDGASRKAVDHATMYEAASMSKPAFAYVVMKLCETGLMKLDTPLTQYTPDRFLADDSRLEQITTRHVLSHTSGFQNWRSEKDPLSIHFTPGERHLYSGEGYNYLQTVVTRLLGQPFESYMKQWLLAPLGMASSGYVWNDVFARRMARPHDANGTPLENKKSTQEAVARYGSAGALLTTPTDFAKFVIAIIAPRPRDTFHLAPSSVAEMLRPHVKLEGGRYPASWALGWQIFHNADRDFIYHGGDNEGFHCFAVASVAGRSGLVVMTNGEGGTAVLQRVLIDGVTQAFLSNK
jgi:CubicO group peptidase (beta-lactamase class C family)